MYPQELEMGNDKCDEYGCHWWQHINDKVWQRQWKTKHDMEKDKDKNIAIEKDLASWDLEPLEHLVGQMTQSMVIWVWCGS